MQQKINRLRLMANFLPDVFTATGKISMDYTPSAVLHIPLTCHADDHGGGVLPLLSERNPVSGMSTQKNLKCDLTPGGHKLSPAACVIGFSHSCQWDTGGVGQTQEAGKAIVYAFWDNPCSWCH